MGYYSDFIGSFKLSKRPKSSARKSIVSQISQVFGNLNGDDGRFGYDGDVFYDENKNEILPTATNMKGYNFESHVKIIANILKSFGISLKGEVFRHGEENDDHERYFFKKGKLYSSSGEIVYKHPKEI